MSVKSSVQHITNGVYRSFKVTDTYRGPCTLTSHCALKLHPWRVFRVSHAPKIALDETQERLKCSGGANQAASECQQSKRDFEQLPLLCVCVCVSVRACVRACVYEGGFFLFFFKGVHSLEGSLV